jgi:hypothetical protein
MSSPPTSSHGLGAGGGPPAAGDNNPEGAVQPQAGQQQQAPTQLEFTQAMTDFKVMFPNVDADVIEAVLRANNGAVDTTIDHLLAMSADNEAEKGTHDGGGDLPPAYTGHPPSYQQATNNSNDEVVGDLINLGGATGGNNSADSSPVDFLSDPVGMDALGASGGGDAAVPEGATGASPKHAYCHPKRQEADEQHYQQQQQNIMPTQQQLHEIYEENLRLREEARGGSTDAASRAQYLEDERVALFLQNEEFMAELRRDTDFMSALEMEQERAYYDQQQHLASSSSATVTSTKSKHMMDEEFREKLKNMGKTSKRKFAQLASMFSRRKSKQLLGAPSKDNLLLNAEPLVNETDTDTEDDQQTSAKATTKQQKTPTKGKYTSFS